MSGDKKDKTLLYTAEDIALFKEYYMTNTKCYAEQLPPNEKNKANWNKVEGNNADFETALLSHFKGTRTIGAYTIILTGENKDCCKNCTFDFDISIAERKEAKRADDKDKEELFKKAIDSLETQVRAFVDYLIRIGIAVENILVSFSGYKGFHVDIFFNEPLPAKTVYEFANSLKKGAKLPDKLEVFPKQPGVSSSSAYGSLVKLPLGVHKLTGKRARFISLAESDESSFGTPFDYLRRTKRMTIDDVSAIMDNLTMIDLDMPTYHSTNGGEIKDLSKPPTYASLTKMMTKCVALRRIEKKAKEGGHLVHDERLALLTLCIYFGDEGNKRLHKIMSYCSDYSQEYTQKQWVYAKDEHKYIPMKCVTMQQSHICAGNCAEIISRDGSSPIKLAYPKAKVDKRLELVEEVEESQCIGKNLSVPFKVVSLVGNSFSVPKEVEFSCPPHCPGKLDVKVPCDYNNKNGIKKIKIANDKRAILSMIDSPDHVVRKICVGLSGIPCLKPNYLKAEIKKRYQIQRMIISSADEIQRNRMFDNKTSIETKSYTAYFNGDNINVSTDYIGIGKAYAHPKNQQTTFLFPRVERMLGDLDEFTPSEEDLIRLKEYKNMNKLRMLRKIGEQITYIVEREKETMLTLMTMFSPLQLEFNGQTLDRGWMEVCFLGDSAQGKSKIPGELLKHAGIYNMVTGGSTTIAGLIGGVDKHDNSNYVAWGVLPNADRTIMFLDEMEELQENTGALKALREARTTGMAVISKIKRAAKACRVRLIASSNPKKGKMMASYRRGVHAILDIMERPDARRFDMFQFFYEGDVPVDEAIKNRQKQKPELSPETLRMMIRWAWTRRPEHFKFTDEVINKIYKVSLKLSKRYIAAAKNIPLIATDVTFKVVRMVAALAVFYMRTEDFIHVTPTVEDVEQVYSIIDGTYSDIKNALHEEAEECNDRFEVEDAWLQRFRRTMTQHNLGENVNIVEAVMHINNLERIRAEELALYLRCSRNDITKLLQLMAVDHLVIADYGGTYRPAPKIHKLARALKDRIKASSKDAAIAQVAEDKPKQTEEDLDELFGKA